MGEIEVNLKYTAAVALCVALAVRSCHLLCHWIHTVFFSSKMCVFVFGRFVFRLSNVIQTRLSNKCDVDSQVAHSMDVFGHLSSLKSIISFAAREKHFLFPSLVTKHDGPVCTLCCYSPSLVFTPKNKINRLLQCGKKCKVH